MNRDNVNELLNWDSVDIAPTKDRLSFDDVCCGSYDELDCPEIKPTRFKHCGHHEDVRCEYGEVECGCGETFAAEVFTCLRGRWMMSIMDCSPTPDNECTDPR